MVKNRVNHPGQKRAARRDAFTFVEVLVVVIIIGVLAALILPQFLGRVGQAEQSVAKQKLSTIEQAIVTFHYDYGRFPQSLDEIVQRPADVPQEEWNPPSIKEKDLEDPWGNQFQYSYPGENHTFDLYSYGADNQPGGSDENADVTNW